MYLKDWLPERQDRYWSSWPLSRRTGAFAGFQLGRHGALFTFFRVLFSECSSGLVVSCLLNWCENKWGFLNLDLRPSYRSMLESMWGALAISMSACYLTLQPCTWLAEQIWPTAPRDAYISELVLGVRLGCPPAVLVAVGIPCRDSMGLASWHLWTMFIPEINGGKACQWSLRDHPLCHQCWGAASKYLKLSKDENSFKSVALEGSVRGLWYGTKLATGRESFFALPTWNARDLLSLMTLEARGQRLGATQRKSWVSAWCHTVPSPESPDMSVQQSNMTIKVPIGTLYPLERFGCTRIAGLPFTWCPSLRFCFLFRLCLSHVESNSAVKPGGWDFGLWCWCRFAGSCATTWVIRDWWDSRWPEKYANRGRKWDRKGCQRMQTWLTYLQTCELVSFWLFFVSEGFGCNLWFLLSWLAGWCWPCRQTVL